MALNISNGIIRRAQKVVIYGPEGVGKSTLAACFPDSVFMDLENGTSHFNADRIEWGKTWNDILNTIVEVVKAKDCCKTLVIDTADKAEQLCVNKVCIDHKVSGIEDIGYGKGYTYIGEEFAKLLSYLDRVIAIGINVVVIAHAKMRKFEQPDELGAYDRWEMKLTKQSAPLMKEWADMILFCNYKTSVAKTKEGSVKAQGGKRVMYTSHHPCWDAKNRHCLPDVLDLDYNEIKEVIEWTDGPSKMARQTQEIPVKTENPEPKKKENEIKKPMPIEILRGKMLEHGISDAEIQKACAMRKLKAENIPLDNYEEEFIKGMLLDHWDAFLNYILKNIKNVPGNWVK